MSQNFLNLFMLHKRKKKTNRNESISILSNVKYNKL